MIRFILKRLLVAIPMLLGMALITFLLIRMSPGNYLDTMRLNPQISPETISHYEKLYQLDKTLIVQYFVWIKNLLRLDFGFSFFYNVEVTTIIGGRLLNTFALSLSAFLTTWLIAIPLGIWAAVNNRHPLNKAIQFSSYIFLSLPSFFMAMMFLFFVSQIPGWPLGGMHDPEYESYSWPMKIWDLIKHLAIPTFALSIGSIAALQRIMRGNMLEALGQQYILTARAKGLPETRVVYRHALRNAINPLITLLGYEFSGLLSGAALIEIICNWPGLGSLMLTAVRSKDVYLVMASMLMGGFLFIVGNLIADILLAKADPRIRYDKN